MRLHWLLLIAAACGDPDGGNTTKQDAAAGDATSTGDAAVTDAAIDAPGTCPMGTATHPTFWATLCDAAATCGWLTNGHAELDYDEAGCNTRHANDPNPSTQLAYLSGFETRINAAAACLGCQALVDAYFRPDLETVFCTHVARCGGNEATCRTQYQQTAMKPGSEAKFDYACPRYCIEQLASDAACSLVVDCLMACS